MDYNSIQSFDDTLEESQNNYNSAMSIREGSEETGCCGFSRRRLDEKSPLLERIQATRTDYESLDYDCVFSKAYKEEKLDTPPTKCYGFKVSIMQWSLTFFIGLFTALVAFFIDYCTSQLTGWKFNTVSHHIHQCNGTTSCIAEGLFMMCGVNLFFVTLAAIAVWIEPIAAGSGIPEIKCYLNGIKIPHVMRLKTLLCKAGGVLFSVSGGLLVGKEGPMIHSGAVIGAGLPQFRSYAIKFLDFGVKTFRRDRDKRDFVSGGAAAGVAAAFGAPIGGVLFSLEEGSSFWNQSLTWRTFFCAMAATFSLNFFMSGLKGFGWGTFYQPGLVNFGTFQCPNEAKECHLWSANDLLVFIVMAIVGGLLGALFNHINMLITIIRLRYIQPKHKLFQVFEVMLVGLVTTVVGFLSAMALGQCRESDPESNVTNTRTYFCHEGYYNDMATLFFNPQEVAIKQLFHQDGTFSVQSLGIFFAVFFLLACWTYGIGVPSGLFVPSLLCGAAYGRLVAKILVDYVGYDIIYSGTFALIGSAAFLGGVVRMTISLTVILIESTNEITYGLPIMIVLMIAKWVGDLFNEGIYDLHIELKGIPFLGWDHAPGIDSLTAKDVMKTELSYIYPYTRVLSVYDLLKSSKHNAFPVVTLKKKQKDFESKSKTLSINERFRKDSTITRIGEQTKRINSSIKKRGVKRDIMTTSSPTGTPPNEESDSFTQPDPYAVPPTPLLEQNDKFRPLRFHGMMLRSHLTVLMHQQIFTTDSALISDPVMQLTQDQLVEDYPRFHDVDQMARDDFANWMILDVTRYMNPSPYTVWPETPLPQVFHLFRSMGLRHLPVVNCEGEILGVITRHNLTIEALEEAKEETKAEQTENSSFSGRRSTKAKLFRKSFMNNSLPI